ncbi:hypothetical protein [Yoonia sp.]|uniref:hypothetical protein n=1 Tax=Yoonia sp. TaxID=2212373 RepID=UPI001A095483|nr:hypothetical protein [Yoonia sp.]MBE0413942.1 hypothetical protein [Yoonia sp.]
MPFNRLSLIIVCVVAAAAVTVWLFTAFFADTEILPLVGLGVTGIVALVAYVAWRLIAERLGNKDDDHYDRFKN